MSGSITGATLTGGAATPVINIVVCTDSAQAAIFTSGSSSYVAGSSTTTSSATYALPGSYRNGTYYVRATQATAPSKSGFAPVTVSADVTNGNITFLP